MSIIICTKRSILGRCRRPTPGLSFGLMVGIATAVCTGCQVRPAAQLIGQWKPDDRSTLGAVLERGDLLVAFRADGSFAIRLNLPMIGSITKEGSWQYVAHDNSGMEIDLYWSDQSRATRLHVVPRSDGTIQFVPPVAPFNAPVRFVRVNSS